MRSCSSLPFLALLAFFSSAFAQTYVQFSNVGYYDATNPDAPPQTCTTSRTSDLCAADARAAGGVGYSVLTATGSNTVFSTCQGPCKIFASYPARCGGISAATNRVTAWVQRCSPSNGQNYNMYGDSTCVPAARQPPTAAEYSAQCAGQSQPTVSSRAYRKRSPIELALPIDEKSIDGKTVFNDRICQHRGPGYQACGVESTFSDKAYKCIDTSSNLDSCGGCPNRGGVDCSELEGTDSVSCMAGHCVAASCRRGFLNLAGTCISLSA